MLAITILPVLALASTVFALPAPQVAARNDNLPNGFFATGRCIVDKVGYPSLSSDLQSRLLTDSSPFSLLQVGDRIFKGADFNSNSMDYASCAKFVRPPLRSCLDQGLIDCTLPTVLPARLAGRWPSVRKGVLLRGESRHRAG